MVLDTLKILSEYCSDRISKVPWGGRRQAWRYMVVIPVLRSLRQEDFEFEASLSQK
jgi:hypothetical protein